MKNSKNYRLANMSLLAALLVVFIHISGPKEIGTAAWYFHYIVRSIFATIAVPYFFCAAGFFLGKHIDEPSWYCDAIRKRVKTLLIPFFFWCGVWTVYSWGIGIVGDVLKHRPIEWSLLPFMTLDYIGLDFTQAPALFTIWFVRMLMLFVLVSPLVIFGVRRWSWLTVCGCVLLHLFIGRFLNYYGFSFLSLAYFTAGIVLARRPIEVNRKLGLVALAIGIFLGFLGMFQSQSQGLLWTCRGIVMTSFLLVGIFACIGGWQLPEWSYSIPFPLYILHLFVIATFASILPQTECTITRMLLDYVLAVVGSVAILFVGKQFCPRFCNVVFGGR